MPQYLIRGLKMSGPLALIRQQGVDRTVCLRILEGLEGLRINLAFAAMANGPPGGWAASSPEPPPPDAAPDCQLSICVDISESAPAFNHTAPLANRYGLKEPEIIEPVVAFDIFPRGRGLDFALAVECALLRAGIEPLALGSSLSAVVAVLPESQARDAVGTIADAFGLDEKTARLKERVAVRQEP